MKKNSPFLHPCFVSRWTRVSRLNCLPRDRSGSKAFLPAFSEACLSTPCSFPPEETGQTKRRKKKFRSARRRGGFTFLSSPFSYTPVFPFLRSLASLVSSFFFSSSMAISFLSTAASLPLPPPPPCSPPRSSSSSPPPLSPSSPSSMSRG